MRILSYDLGNAVISHKVCRKMCVILLTNWRRGVKRVFFNKGACQWRPQSGWARLSPEARLPATGWSRPAPVHPVDRSVLGLAVVRKILMTDRSQGPDMRGSKNNRVTLLKLPEKPGTSEKVLVCEFKENNESVKRAKGIHFSFIFRIPAGNPGQVTHVASLCINLMGSIFSIHGASQQIGFWWCF